MKKFLLILLFVVEAFAGRSLTVDFNCPNFEFSIATNYLCEDYLNIDYYHVIVTKINECEGDVVIPDSVYATSDLYVQGRHGKWKWLDAGTTVPVTAIDGVILFERPNGLQIPKTIRSIADMYDYVEPWGDDFYIRDLADNYYIKKYLFQDIYHSDTTYNTIPVHNQSGYPDFNFPNHLITVSTENSFLATENNSLYTKDKKVLIKYAPPADAVGVLNLQTDTFFGKKFVLEHPDVTILPFAFYAPNLTLRIPRSVSVVNVAECLGGTPYFKSVIIEDSDEPLVFEGGLFAGSIYLGRNSDITFLRSVGSLELGSKIDSVQLSLSYPRWESTNYHIFRQILFTHKIKFASIVPPDVKRLYYDQSIEKMILLEVPLGSKYAYSQHSTWQKFNIIEYEPTYYDINGDGVVDIVDVNIMIDLMLGKFNPRVPSGFIDLTSDGLMDIADVNAVINAMLGKAYDVPTGNQGHDTEPRN